MPTTTIEQEIARISSLTDHFRSSIGLYRLSMEIIESGDMWLFEGLIEKGKPVSRCLQWLVLYCPLEVVRKATETLKGTYETLDNTSEILENAVEVSTKDSFEKVKFFLEDGFEMLSPYQFSAYSPDYSVDISPPEEYSKERTDEILKKEHQSFLNLVVLEAFIQNKTWLVDYILSKWNYTPTEWDIQAIAVSCEDEQLEAMFSFFPDLKDEVLKNRKELTEPDNDYLIKVSEYYCQRFYDKLGLESYLEIEDSNDYPKMSILFRAKRKIHTLPVTYNGEPLTFVRGLNDNFLVNSQGGLVPYSKGILITDCPSKLITGTDSYLKCIEENEDFIILTYSHYGTDFDPVKVMKVKQ